MGVGLQRVLGAVLATAALTTGPLAGEALGASAGAKCPSDAKCGSVRVPVDPAQPALGSLRIAYELYEHDRSGPAKGTIVPLEGGPGSSNTVYAGDWREIFGPLLDRFDLLLIDNRGTGKSGAIECKGVQHEGVTRANVEACARQLGPSRDFYRSASVADDIDRVRAALGIEKIDLYGFSWGSLQARAYAVRYGDRLRSLVLDSSGQKLDVLEWASDTYRNHPRGVRLVCRRSTTCRATGEDPLASIRRLIARLRRDPVLGTSFGLDGERLRLKVDEAALANAFYSLTFADAVAAAGALSRGDERPLLRLIAENRFVAASFENGDPREFSEGDLLAVECNEDVFPWNWQSSVAARKDERRAAYAALPSHAFGLFSAEAVRDDPGYDNRGCIWWPAPADQEPPVPDGAPYPGVPELSISGDLDGAPAAIARGYASHFKHGRFIELANVIHGVVFDSACGRRIVQRFIARLDAGEARCANRVARPLFGYSLYPERVRDERASARSLAGDESTRRDRKAVAAAVDTIVDASLHGFSGHGLRGGRCREVGGSQLILDRCRFVADLAVTGKATYRPNSRLIDGRVTIAGPGSDDGELRIRPLPKATSVIVSGTIGGRAIHVARPIRN